MNNFNEKLAEYLAKIGPENLLYDKSESWMYSYLYVFIQDYASNHELFNTSLALPIVRSLLSGTYRGYKTRRDGTKLKRPYMYHILSVTRMLINLNLPLTHDEEDILLASALCHDLKTNVSLPLKGQEMHDKYLLDQRIVDIMMLIYTGDCISEDDFSRVFKAVRQNRLALMIRLADRGNIVEELYNFSLWRMQEYIHETRTYYLPMAIYAREFYPEFDPAVGILQSKMHDLIASTDIFITRYHNRQKELSEKILLLEEENARMRSVLRKHGYAIPE